MTAETPEQSALLAELDDSLGRPRCECPARHGIMWARGCSRDADTYSRWHCCWNAGGAALSVYCATCEREFELMVVEKLNRIASAGMVASCPGCGMRFTSLADMLLEVGDLP